MLRHSKPLSRRSPSSEARSSTLISIWKPRLHPALWPNPEQGHTSSPLFTIAIWNTQIYLPRKVSLSLRLRIFCLLPRTTMLAMDPIVLSALEGRDFWSRPESNRRPPVLLLLLLHPLRQQHQRALQQLLPSPKRPQQELQVPIHTVLPLIPSQCHQRLQAMADILNLSIMATHTHRLVDMHLMAVSSPYTVIHQI